MWKSVLRGLRWLPGVRRAPEPPPSAPLNAFERARVDCCAMKRPEATGVR
jgi:hypothetical protein